MKPLSNTTDTGPETTAEPALQEMITLGAAAILIGEEAGDYAGYAISGVGDVNGNGWPDLAIGAYRYGGRGDYTGAACLLLGGMEE